MRQAPIIRLPQLNDGGGDLSKKWFVYYSVRDPKTGQMERFKDYRGLGKCDTSAVRYQKAKTLIDELTEKLRTGWTPFNDPSVVYPDNLQFQTAAKAYRKAVAANGTFAYFGSKFLDSLKSTLDPATLSTYRSKLRCFNEWLQSRRADTWDVSAINRDMMVQFFNFIIDERKLSKNSTQKYEQIIYNVFQSVCKERKTTFNPVTDMPKTSRINDHTPRPIRDNHIELIKDVLEVRDPQLFLACKFEYYCCLRPGKELRLLKIKDIDLFRGTVDVSAFRSKTKMARIVTIPAAFLTELRDMELDRLPGNWYVISHDGKPGPTYLGKNNLKQRWSAIRKEMNLPESYKLYSWKHTGNVRADDAGVSREELQTQNGHSSMKTTEIYLQHKGGNISKKVRDLWPTL